MFMRPDGNFTRKDVIATEGDTICVVVLVSRWSRDIAMAR